MDKYNTQISKNNYTKIKEADMAPDELIEFLEDGALFRTFRNVLETAYPGEDLPIKLAKGLSEITGIEYPNVLRKVNNWIKRDCGPKSREDLFQICFALGLDEEDSNRLLSSSSESKIHYRDPKELVYAFALRSGQNYGYAVHLAEKLKPVYEYEMKNAGTDHTIYTKQIRARFADVQTEGALEKFLKDYGRNLGEIHKTAYDKFIKLLDKLQGPEGGEEKYSVEKVVDEYLRMNVPRTKKTGDFSYLQKVIRKNWPSQIEISKMKNKKMDVSRKVMLLLFLITEDYEYDPTYNSELNEKDWDIYYEDLLENDPMARLETRLNKIDVFLGNYGMNLLDPGNPFDCLVLYALRAQEPASEQVESALKHLFGGKNMQDTEHEDDNI